MFCAHLLQRRKKGRLAGCRPSGECRTPGVAEECTAIMNTVRSLTFLKGDTGTCDACDELVEKGVLSVVDICSPKKLCPLFAQQNK